MAVPQVQINGGPRGGSDGSMDRAAMAAERQNQMAMLMQMLLNQQQMGLRREELGVQRDIAEGNYKNALDVVKAQGQSAQALAQLQAGFAEKLTKMTLDIQNGAAEKLENMKWRGIMATNSMNQIMAHILGGGDSEEAIQARAYGVLQPLSSQADGLKMSAMALTAAFQPGMTAEQGIQASRKAQQQFEADLEFLQTSEKIAATSATAVAGALSKNPEAVTSLIESLDSADPNKTRQALGMVNADAYIRKVAGDHADDMSQFIATALANSKADPDKTDLTALSELSKKMGPQLTNLSIQFMNNLGSYVTDKAVDAIKTAQPTPQAPLSVTPPSYGKNAFTDVPEVMAGVNAKADAPKVELNAAKAGIDSTELSAATTMQKQIGPAFYKATRLMAKSAPFQNVSVDPLRAHVEAKKEIERALTPTDGLPYDAKRLRAAYYGWAPPEDIKAAFKEFQQSLPPEQQQLVSEEAFNQQVQELEPYYATTFNANMFAAESKEIDAQMPQVFRDVIQVEKDRSYRQWAGKLGVSLKAMSSVMTSPDFALGDAQIKEIESQAAKLGNEPYPEYVFLNNARADVAQKVAAQREKALQKSQQDLLKATSESLKLKAKQEQQQVQAQAQSQAMTAGMQQQAGGMSPFGLPQMAPQGMPQQHQFTQPPFPMAAANAGQPPQTQQGPVPPQQLGQGG